MDISEINRKTITTEGGFHFGDPNAPVKVVEFINLRCPFCKMWWKTASAVLDEYEKNGKVERIVKHFDKKKPGLDKGNVLHSYLDYGDPERTREDIDYYVDHLDEWGNLSKADIATYAEDKRQSVKQNNSDQSEAVINETEKANVSMVPTVVIGEHIFDENILEDELKQIIEEELLKNG
ncbi:thioredoxin domain-containing protein [Alkalibacterium sp. f15]|uniref:thioredoxin domain-containing protein n=1 Tax=Alkalibacterium sp. f15 TaxID=3414029 RepID=UPI003BF8B5F3